ncbi:hypothetical protein DP923_09885 [Pontibacter arcticus]|uniref:Uncharacterized protein n=1 Tax=Pontibacter arcticus TaxID=2080288 RepID=A0A364RCP8_9BACT|nr:hypothetical protein DP923_09885 [Pontibacter arcticus]
MSIEERTYPSSWVERLLLVAVPCKWQPVAERGQLQVNSAMPENESQRTWSEKATYKTYTLKVEKAFNYASKV